MGRDYKTGLISGLILAVIALIWVATRPSLGPEARALRSSQAAGRREAPERAVPTPQKNLPPSVPSTQGAEGWLPGLSSAPATSPNVPVAQRPESTQGVSPAGPPAARQPESPDLTVYERPEKIKTTRFHIVRKDETLSAISQQYYGSPTKWRQILQANEQAIKDANRIQPGTKLIIPD